MLNKIMVKKDILLYLIDHIYGNDRNEIKNEALQYQLVETKLLGNLKSTSLHSLIFKLDGKYYQAPDYNIALTEASWDEPPYSFEEDLLECCEVERKEVIAYEYVPLQTKQYILNESDLIGLIKSSIISENIIDNCGISHDDLEGYLNMPQSEIAEVVSKYKEYQAN